MDIQKLRLKAETIGWPHWTDGDRLSSSGKNHKRPDALCLDNSNNNVAVESERTFKSLKRYEQILVNYLMLLKAAEINSVVWVSPTSEMAERLKSIQHVQVAGQKVQIDPLKHYSNLHFCLLVKAN